MKLVIAIRRTLSKRWLIVCAAVVATCVAIAGWAWAGSSSETAPRLGTASLGMIRQTVSATGTIAAAQQANLNFGVAGQVTAVPVAVGQQVKAGQVLATVDAASLPSQVAQARAAVAASQAKVASDEASGASAAQINADNAALTSSNAQLTVAQQNLARSSLVAPFDGTVAAITLTAGQQVSGASSTGAGASTSASGGPSAAAASSTTSAQTTSAANAQIVVISTGTYIVNANVDDTQVSQLRSGEQAVIVPNGSTGPIFGTVASVGMIGSQSSGVTNYPVTINVTGSSGNLPIGATAQVSIIVKQLSDVIVVPRAAVHFEGGQSVVYQLSGGQQVAHPVTVGLSAGGQTQITGGLAAGSRIVLPAAPAGSGTGRTGGLGGGFGGAGGGFGGAGGGGRGPGGRTG
ncbi:MAG TPA: biotin/lipoyl-binding protein [Pseudonocardiaceae bacterium]|nr:biotin/lipoyl-binding protein [Pseudonocardiaceae bacterium]